MAPKFDANAVTYVYLRQYGGEQAPSSVLAPKIGPLGLSPKKIGDDIVKATMSWKGIRVMVKLTIQNRQAKVDMVPTATSLLIKELKEPPRDRKKVKNIAHDGNITWDDVYATARAMRSRSNAKEFKGTVLEVLGTCRALGCTIDGDDADDATEAVQDGDQDVPDN